MQVVVRDVYVELGNTYGTRIRHRLRTRPEERAVHWPQIEREPQGCDASDAPAAKCNGQDRSDAQQPCEMRAEIDQQLARPRPAATISKQGHQANHSRAECQWPCDHCRRIS